jgi:hypothetical protein
VISAFFKILNFVVFVGVVAYYFRKNFIGYIMNQLLRRKGLEEDLINQQKSSSSEYHSIENQQRYQENLYKTLDEKIKIWKNRIQDEHEREKQACLEYERELRERFRHQHEYWKMISISKEVMPCVFDSTAQNLEKMFQDEKRIHTYYENSVELLVRSK